MTNNALLRALSPSDRELIQPFLIPVDLAVRTRLETRNKPVPAAYFIESGVASIVTFGDLQVEVGIVGSEGMIGFSVILGGRVSPLDTYMQVAGSALLISADDLTDAAKRSPTLQATFLRYVQDFILQLSDTVVANARGSTHQRLARWLLMVQDRVGCDTIPLTHEFMAVMLGIQRSGLTLALHPLEHSDTIEQRRGAVIIRDREALLAIAAELYQPAGFSSVA
jgi:CRP-like cAMP-binding protein